MTRRMITGWGGALAVSALILAGCGSATQSTTTAASSAGQASAQTTANAATTLNPVTSRAPIAAAVDPCSLITADEAKAALGADTGPGKPAAGTPACTYGTPGSASGYMLVADADTSSVPGFQDFNRDAVRAKVQQSIAKTGGTVTDTSGVGDWGFLVLQPGRSGSYIFFVKGSVYVSIIVIPAANPVMADVMTALAKSAADRV